MEKKTSMEKKTISIFFGAGAEITYGVPNGGEFALNIFRQNQSDAKKRFKEEIAHINPSSFQAREWLPENYQDKQISSFSKTQHENLLKSSLEYKKSQLLKSLNSFDTRFVTLLQSYEIDMNEFDKFITDTYEIKVDEVYYTHKVQFSKKLKEDFKLFDQKYFSLLLELSKLDIFKEHFQTIKTLSKTFIEFGVGVFGSELIKDLNESLFSKKPDDIDIFDEISGMFSIDISKVGLEGLSLILNSESKSEDELKESFKILDNTKVVELYKLYLESIIKDILDYQDLIDANFRYLYSPKTDWSKFIKIAIFLYNVESYIKKENKKILDTIKSTSQGYYHDIKELNKSYSLKCVGTSNYTTFIYNFIDKEKVIHLNGSIDDKYDPYKNTIVEYSDTSSFTVPFLFTQSGTKPLTSIKVSQKYNKLYEEFRSSDKIVVIGYGFNVDDGHINGIFRTLIEDDQKEIIILSYSKEHDISYYQRKLRLSSLSKLKVLAIDKDRNFDDTPWCRKI